MTASTESTPTPGAGPETPPAVAALERRLLELGPLEAAELVEGAPVPDAAHALTLVPPDIAVAILWQLPEETRRTLIAAAPNDRGEQWLRDHDYPEESVGRLMEKALAVFRPETTVGEAIERLRDLIRRAHITYGFVTDAGGVLVGVFAFRELLFGARDQPLGEIMHPNPFFLRPETTAVEAMRAVVTLHFPAYPVCDERGRLLGLVRGQVLFQHQAFEISAQAGSMVGVEKEERLSTGWPRSLKFRHPWLQLNLLTAFTAAAVVGTFQDTVDQIVVLAMFLPVLAGQSGNTGCQALAVTLRGMTLGELGPGKAKRLVSKEAWLGLLNGVLVGLVAGGGMYVVARSQQHPQPLLLALVVWLAMLGSCMVSGVCGALVPITLKRLGADPATASSIFLTTATDVVSMGLFLGLATWLIL